MKQRQIIQWILVGVFFITLGLGWKYPLLGFIVPIVMISGIVISLKRGRYLCGNLCPRGSFFDRVLSKICRGKQIPRFLRNMYLRWFVLIVMMGFMIFRIMQNPSDVNHWGRVFWFMCFVTSIIGIVLGVFFHPRAWCAFCPSGTMQNVLGRGKYQIKINSARCIKCNLCKKECPFDIIPFGGPQEFSKTISNDDNAAISHPDCLKCLECVYICPKAALMKPSSSK